MMETTEKKQISYIAGQITNDPDYKEKFDYAERELKEHGFVVLNPTILPLGMEYEQYMDITHEMLKCADTLFLLTGWDHSPGAKRELCTALARDLTIHDYHYWCLCNHSEAQQ